MKLKKTIKSLVIFVLVFALFMSNWPPAWNNSGLPGEVPVVYADSVTYDRNDTWNVPDGVTEFTVELWGGGGAGGGTVTTNGAGGGGGAGGQYVSKTITVDSSSYSFTVGAGGSTTSGNGNAGGDTVFGSNLAVAKGGAGGASFSNGGAGGVGSTTGGIGDVVYRGGNGGNSSSGVAGGGGGAGSTGDGNHASGATAGAAKTDFGGAGGNGGTGNNSNGFAGDIYGGGGGSGTGRNGSPAAGAGGFVRITYTVDNSAPTFTVIPSDDPDPVDSGSNVTFTATATDPDSDTWYLAICKTDSITADSPPTCAAEQTLCVSSSAVASGTENSCTWESGSPTTQSWYAFACDTASTPNCSASNSTNSPVTVQEAQIVSISLSSDGSIDYGTLPPGTTVNTLGLADTQVVVNEGNVAIDLDLLPL